MTVPVGGTATVSWVGMSSPASNDWIGLYAVGAPNTSYLKYQYTGGKPDGSLAFTMPAAPGTYEFRLFAKGGYTLLATSNAVTVTPAQARADLAIVKTDSPDPVHARGTLAYTLAVSNAGPSTAASVTVTDTLPAGVTFGSASGGGWGCSHSAGTVTCTRPNLPVGTAPPITITVTAPTAGGTIRNTATVSAATDDPDAANNIGREDTNVVPPSSQCPPTVGFGQVIQCSVGSPGEVDSFTFEPQPRVGDDVRLRLERTSGNLEATLRVYRPDGTEAPWCWTSGGPAHDLPCTLDATGPHSVLVVGSGMTSGAYTLLLSD
jgi:uncharacterized repeat protein (TIGR01451 family)